MQRQFEDLKASELFCPKCRVARPVRERLLLVLPRADLHDYRCMVCGTSCGQREVRHPVGPVPLALAPAARKAPRGLPRLRG